MQTSTMIKNRSEMQSVRLTTVPNVNKPKKEEQPMKLSFFQRLLCCGSKNRTLSQQSATPGNHF